MNIGLRMTMTVIFIIVVHFNAFAESVRTSPKGQFRYVRDFTSVFQKQTLKIYFNHIEDFVPPVHSLL